MRSLRGLAIVAALSIPVVFTGLANHTFWFSGEPFAAEIAREMAVSGDWIVPRLNGRPFLEKPPLQPALVALSYRILGVTPLASRLPSALAVLMTVLVTYLLGARLFDERTALWAALLYPTISQVFAAGHFCLTDPLLALFVATGFLAAAYAFGPDRRPWATPALCASAALAFLAKGVVGPGLLALGVVTFALVRGDWRLGGFRRLLLGAAIGAALVGPWAVSLARAGGRPLLREAFVVNTVGRYFYGTGLVPADDDAEQHPEPLWFYVTNLPENFLSWTPLLLLAVASAVATARHRWRAARTAALGPPGARAPGDDFLWAMFVPGFLIVSGADSKRGVYLLPFYTLLALLVAHHARRAVEDGAALPAWKRAFLGMQAAVTLAFGVAVPAAYVYFSESLGGATAGTGTKLWSGALVVVAVAGSAVGWAAFRRRRFEIFFATLWLQTLIALLGFAALCVPAMEPSRSYARFFGEAVRIERSRERVPALLMHHEALIGYAGLYFGRLLPRFEPSAPGTPDVPTAGSLDLLVDGAGLDALKRIAGAGVTVLLAPSAQLWNPRSSPYLVSCACPGAVLPAGDATEGAAGGSIP